MKGILLIIGSGSIGRRHAKNACSLGLRIIVCDIDINRAKSLAEETGSENFYADYKKACEENPDIEAAIISTPSQFHVENAKFLAERGIHIFIEKPLASEMNGIDDLVNIIESKNVVAMMGQSYRFHEGYLYLKEMLDNGLLGKIYHVAFLSGQYLPDWHPDIDYRIEYMAQSKLGGGALRTSMSHLFDSVAWFFGDVVDSIGHKARLSDLDMDVDDSVFCLIKTNKNIVVMCQTDFLQRSSNHRMFIVGEKGNIDADFVNHQFVIDLAGKERSVQKYSFDPNQRYIDELKHFLELIEAGSVKHDLDVFSGKKVVELILSDNIYAITEI